MEDKKEHYSNYKNFIEESAEELYENAPCGYLSTLQDGTIVKINTTLANWLGYYKPELLFLKKFQDLLSIGGKLFFETHIRPLLKMQGFVNEINFDLLAKNKSLLPVLVNTVAVKSNGETMLYRTTIFNITDRKKYEVELLKAKQKAEEASKAKAEFLSTISHEIRTPMNAIIGVANLLLEDDHSEKQRQYLQILKTSSDNLLNLVNDILDFSKIESGKLSLEEKTFNLRDIINTVLFSLGVKAEEKGLEVKVDIDNEIPEYVKGDPVKLTQVITNLIGNAIKFTEKGYVSLLVKLISETNDKAFLYFEVQDTGRGISKDKLSKIFEEFTQENYDINLIYGGTGLGLTISQKLLQMFGSKIEVESELGMGAKFSFKIILGVGDKNEVEDVNLFKNGESNQLLKGVCLLLAEDNPVNVFIVSQYFNHWGIKFDVAENGQMAIEMILQKDYDIVLMDLQMPVLNGYTASQKVRELGEEKFVKLPIIALTASARSDIKEKIIQSKINDFVSKPFNPKSLYNTIAQYTHMQATEDETAIEFKDVDTDNSPEEAEIVDLSYFTQITKRNPEKIPELIAVTRDGFQKYKADFVKAIEERSLILFEQIEHRSKMVITVLKAISLQNKIAEVELLFHSELTEEFQWDYKQQEIEVEFDRVLDKLKIN